MNLQPDFFERAPLICARELIGCELVWNECAGVIVETEAYSVINDEACHTFLRPSAREFVATNRSGIAYVYLNYGMHWLLNVLLKGPEEGFVLIRAVEPTRGVELMETRRHQSKRIALCSGPAKLCQAFGISGADHGRDLCSEVTVGFRPSVASVEIVEDVRIGISKAANLPWRFLLKDSPFVSVPPLRSKAPRRNLQPGVTGKRKSQSG
ncbi:MAG: DNA-3-methyladenine glycosylase [Verrucomicrobiaceae bacterium]|nr:MAG: DNA-3-methyladenine glycosylase [Verrucomicrobiaceae bacterium]